MCYEPEAANVIESIGAFCSFAIGTRVVVNHPMDMVTTSRVTYAGAENWWPEFRGMTKTLDYQKTIIGNDVWLGANVIIKSGVRIGNGVIAGAGAVITKDVPDYAIVIGIPAKVIRYRFTMKQISALNKIAWWDWPIEKIKTQWDDFKNIDAFIANNIKD